MHIYLYKAFIYTHTHTHTYNAMLNMMQAQSKHSINASFVCFIWNKKQQ